MSTGAEKESHTAETPESGAASSEPQAPTSQSPPAHPVGTSPAMPAQPYWQHPPQYYQQWGQAAPGVAPAPPPAMPTMPSLPFAPNLPAPTPEEFQRVMLYAHMQQQQHLQQQQQQGGQMPSNFPGYPYFGYHPGMMSGMPSGLSHGLTGENREGAMREKPPTRVAASKYVGVKWDRRHKQWRSSVVVDGKQEALGLFASEIDAAKAYDAAAAKHNKPLNFVGGADPGDGSAASSGDVSQRNKPVSSNYVGVSFNRKNQKWLTQITESGKQVYLGSFNTELEAARKYDEAAAELGKPLNLPDEGSNAKRAVKGKARAESEGTESCSGVNSATSAAAASVQSSSGTKGTTTKEKGEGGTKDAGAEAAACSAAAAASSGTPGSDQQPANGAPPQWSQSQPFMHLPGQPVPPPTSHPSDAAAAAAVQQHSAPPPPYPPPPLGPPPVFGMPPGYIAPQPGAPLPPTTAIAPSGGGDEGRPTKKRKGKQDGNDAADVDGSAAAGPFVSESAVI